MNSGTEAAKDCTFEKFSDELQDIYDKIRMIEPSITGSLQDIAGNTGGELAGLEFSIKTASSIENKLERQENQLANLGIPFDAVSQFESFSDILRYTEILPSDTLADTIPSLLSEFEKAGFSVVEIDNKFENPISDTHYKGLHIGLVSPQGQRVEFQVHTKESFETKMECHSDYEIYRDVTGKYSDSEKTEACTRMKEAYDSVPDVPDMDKIESFQMDKESIRALCDNLAMEYQIKEEDPYEVLEKEDSDPPFLQEEDSSAMDEFQDM